MPWPTDMHGTPVAFALPLPEPRPAQWWVIQCPFCREGHLHGDPGPGATMYRVAHCCRMEYRLWDVSAPELAAVIIERWGGRPLTPEARRLVEALDEGRLPRRPRPRQTRRRRP